VLWRNKRTGANAIWYSGSEGSAQAMKGVTDLAWKIVGTGDFDGDGKSDVMWRNNRTGAAAIWKSGNYNTQQAMTRVTNLAWQIVGTGDLDGDGKSDVLWRNGRTGANTIWKSANSSMTLAMRSVTDLAWKIVGTGDFNGDGKDDVVWRNDRTGANAIWKSGSYNAPQAMTAVTNLAWQIVATGDFNGDGRSDVLWRNKSTGAGVIWKSASAGTRSPSAASPTRPGPSSPDAAEHEAGQPDWSASSFPHSSNAAATHPVVMRRLSINAVVKQHEKRASAPLGLEGQGAGASVAATSRSRRLAPAVVHQPHPLVYRHLRVVQCACARNQRPWQARRQAADIGAQRAHLKSGFGECRLGARHVISDVTSTMRFGKRGCSLAVLCALPQVSRESVSCRNAPSGTPSIRAYAASSSAPDALPWRRGPPDHHQRAALAFAPPRHRAIDATPAGQVQHGEVIRAARCPIHATAQDHGFGWRRLVARLGHRHGPRQQSPEHIRRQRSHGHHGGRRQHEHT
jgi:hypothetical protein